MAQTNTWRVNNDQRLTATLADTLKDLGTLSATPYRPLAVTLLDTFDWRLYRKRRVLVLEEESGQHALRLRKSGAADREWVLPVAQIPRFAVDLPKGPMQRKLAGILAMRALLARATVDVRRRTYQLRDGEGKTTLRLHHERLKIRTDTGPPTSLTPRMTIEPLRGYGGVAATAGRRLADLPELSPGNERWEIAAYRAAGSEPGDYDAKLHLVLNPETRSDEALRSLLREITASLRINEPGMRQAIDTEYLHEYRVAVRRLRSLLSQMKDIFPARPRDRFRTGFAWLGQVTSPARDLDVYLLHFDDYQSLLPPDLRTDLEPLRTFLAERQLQAYRELNRNLDSARYRTLLSAWQAFLDVPPPTNSRLPNAMQPIKAVADARTWRAYRKVIKRGGKITDESPPEALHALRIRCKKLRYLLEFFRSLYPGRRIGRTIKALKRLQDVLGRFQDLQVQQEALRRFQDTMTQTQAIAESTVRAMAELIDHLKLRHDEARNHYGEQFKAFSTPARQRDFHDLFHANARGHD